MNDRYDAFISYSVAADGRLAPALQTGLQQFLKPWYQLRAMRVFRDQTGLAVTPHLWGSIQHGLERSKYFVLLASPSAAQSAWVEQEIQFWLKHRSPDRLLIVCTDGEIAWNRATGDFDWEKTNALPRCLSNVFKEEPKYGDLRWARESVQLSLRRPRFLEEVAKLSAAIRGLPLDIVFAQDAAQHRKTMRVLAAIAVVLVILTVVASGAAVLGFRAKRSTDEWNRARTAELREKAAREEEVRRQEEKTKREAAERQRLEGIADQWARRATELTNRALSQLIALAAVNLAPTPAAENALRRALIPTVPPQPRILSGHDQAIISHVEFSPDGRRLLSAGGDSVCLWDVAGGTNIWTAQPQGRITNETTFATFGANGRRVMTLRQSWSFSPTDEGTDVVEIREAATGALRRVITNSPTTHAVFSGDGLHVATLSRFTVQVWNADNGGKERELKGHSFHVVSGAFSADGRWLATGSWDDTVRVWDLGNGECRATVPALQRVNWVTFNPDATRLYALSATNSGLRVWDWAKFPGSSLHSFPGGQASIESLALSPDGKTLVTGDHEGTVRIWDATTAQGRHVLEAHEEPVTDLAISPNNRWLVTVSIDRAARIWDLDRGAELCPLGTDRSARTCVGFSADGEHIAVGSADGEVLLYTCEVCGPVEKLKTLARPPDGRKLTEAESNEHLQPKP